MLPKNNEKEDSSNLVDEESKQLQGETLGDSLKNSLTIISIIFFVVIITWTLFQIGKVSTQQKLLAWCSDTYNKIRIVEIETQREFANFDGVKLSKAASIFLALHFRFNSITIH